VVVFVVITARRLGSRGWALALGLLLAGSLGNLTDRMFRAPGPGRGEVVDFVQLPHYPIFNVADSAIVCAAVLIAVLAFRGVGIDGTRVSTGKPGQSSTGDDLSKSSTAGAASTGSTGSTGPSNESPLNGSPTDQGLQIDGPESKTRSVPPPHPTGTDHDV